MKCTRCFSYYKQMRAAAYLEYMELGELYRNKGKVTEDDFREIRKSFTGNLLVSQCKDKPTAEILRFFISNFPQASLHKVDSNRCKVKIQTNLLAKYIDSTKLSNSKEQLAFLYQEGNILRTLLPNCEVVAGENSFWYNGEYMSWEVNSFKELEGYKDEIRICPLTSEQSCAAYTYASLAVRYFFDSLELLKCLQSKPKISKLDDILYDIRYRSAMKGGIILNKKAPKNQLPELVEYYWGKFPTVDIEMLTDDILICKARTCAFHDGLVEMGIDSRDFQVISKLGCICDQAAIEGFNPEIKFSQSSNLLFGDDCCRWEFTL